MAGPYREKIFGYLYKIETTPGVDAAPSNTVDGLRVVGIPTLKVGFLEPGMRDDVVTGQLGAAGRTTPAGRYASIDVQVEVKGAGGAYAVGVLVPEVDAVLRTAGLGRTFVAGSGSESVLYRTIDNPSETGTMWCYGAGKLFKVVGCVATLKGSATAAKRGMLNATITGVLTADPTEASLPVISYSSVLPPLFHSAIATIGGWSSAAGSDALVLKDAGFDLGNTITDRPSAGAVDGHAGYLISDRKARQDMTVEVPALTTFDGWTLSKSTGSALPLSTWQIGTAQYNRMKVRTGRWQLESPDMGAVNALSTLKLNGNLLIGESPTSSREIELLFD